MSTGQPNFRSEDPKRDEHILRYYLLQAPQSSAPHPIELPRSTLFSLCLQYPPTIFLLGRICTPAQLLSLRLDSEPHVLWIPWRYMCRHACRYVVAHYTVVGLSERKHDAWLVAGAQSYGKAP